MSDRYTPSRRTRVAGAVTLGLIGAVLLFAYFYDRSRRDLIAPGVRIAGVDVGRLRGSAARARVRGELQAAHAGWINLRFGARHFTLTGTQAHLSVDVDGAVRHAVAASRGGWFVPRAARELFGGHVDRNIPLPATYRRSKVAQLISRIHAAIDRPARDASVAVDGGGRLVTVSSRRGATVETQQLRAELASALSEPTSSHWLNIPVRISRPRVTTRMLAARYPAYIVVDRPAFKLLLYQHLNLTHSYGIAVGMAGLQTPAGLHHILDKQVDPAWHVPNSSWAGSLAGRVIPPGPQDPLVARWMAIDDHGDGIHGTNEPGSIGSAASHGCIRMLVPDVIQLYSMTPLGTPVYVI
jgi:hypothetical protein